MPPSGPAMPLTEKVQSVLRSFAAPCAISRVHCSLTDPHILSVCSLTPSTECLTLFVYETIPPAKTSEEPGIAVMAAETKPPVQDSADANVLFLFRKRVRTCSPAGGDLVNISAIL